MYNESLRLHGVDMQSTSCTMSPYGSMVLICRVHHVQWWVIMAPLCWYVEHIMYNESLRLLMQLLRNQLQLSPNTMASVNTIIINHISHREEGEQPNTTWTRSLLLHTAKTTIRRLFSYFLSKFAKSLKNYMIVFLLISRTHKACKTLDLDISMESYDNFSVLRSKIMQTTI